jgi:hypothetical protein
MKYTLEEVGDLIRSAGRYININPDVLGDLIAEVTAAATLAPPPVPPVTTVMDVQRAMVKQAFAASLNKACDQAGSASSSWEQYKDATLDELAARLAPDGVRFYHDNGGGIERCAETAERALKALPFITPTGTPDVQADT